MTNVKNEHIQAFLQLEETNEKKVTENELIHSEKATEQELLQTAEQNRQNPPDPGQESGAAQQQQQTTETQTLKDWEGNALTAATEDGDGQRWLGQRHFANGLWTLNAMNPARGIGLGNGFVQFCSDWRLGEVNNGEALVLQHRKIQVPMLIWTKDGHLHTYRDLKEKEDLLLRVGNPVLWSERYPLGSGFCDFVLVFVIELD